MDEFEMFAMEVDDLEHGAEDHAMNNARAFLRDLEARECMMAHYVHPVGARASIRYLFKVNFMIGTFRHRESREAEIWMPGRHITLVRCDEHNREGTEKLLVDGVPMHWDEAVRHLTSKEGIAA